MTHLVAFGWQSAKPNTKPVLRYLRLRADRKTYDAAERGDRFTREEAERLAKQYGGKAVPHGTR